MLAAGSPTDLDISTFILPENPSDWCADTHIPFSRRTAFSACIKSNFFDENKDNVVDIGLRWPGN